MAIAFDNFARQVGERGEYVWFDWIIFVAEPMDELGKVAAVEYRLHETFPNPVRLITDPSSRFALRSAGWGEFTIFITVYFHDGSEEQTTYELDLDKPWPEDDASSRPTVTPSTDPVLGSSGF
jgi:transcription initiation factor IIF auxiliary subunit